MTLPDEPILTVLSTDDPMVRPLAGWTSFASAVHACQAGGAAFALVGLASQEGWKLVRTPEGIIAVLIGLLLPALQRLAQPASADLTMLLRALDAQHGSVGVVMASGRVHPLVRVPPPRTVSAYVIKDVLVSS